MPRRNRSQPHVPFKMTANCQKKRRFASKDEAEKAAEIQMLVQPKLGLSTYKCESCGGWHLTRQARTM